MKKIQNWLKWHSVWHHIAAPIWLRIPAKLRWDIVAFLNRSRNRCWCDLVSDALAEPQDDACDIYIPALRPEKPGCSSTCDYSHPDHTGEHRCQCYCGKFRFTAPNGYIDRKAAR